MLHNTIGHLFRLRIVHKLQVRHSALFINGTKATETFVYITPQIDYHERIKNKEMLQEELRRRKYIYSLDKIEDLWAVYTELNQKKLDFEKKKGEVSRELSKLMKFEPNNTGIEKLQIDINLLKENIKKLKSPIWSAEENAFVEALSLPNKIHHLTPDDKTTVLYTHLDPPKCKKDHLKIGNDLNLLKFTKNENYYLKNEAAIFELGVKFYFSSILKNYNFIQFSNPDFVKSLIVEGCGIDHKDPDTTFILHHNEDTKVNIDSRLHLTGGGSLASFMAYHAKNVIYPKCMPLKYFTMGRQYTPAPSEEDSLFHVSQATVVQAFGVTRDSTELDNMLEDLQANLKAAYSGLRYHYRLCMVPADKLLKWESLRLSVEMFSTSLGCYVEVGNVSVSGDYISKRLQFSYVDKKLNIYPQILSGTLVNVPKLLACILEQETEFNLPEQFKVENWSL